MAPSLATEPAKAAAQRELVPESEMAEDEPVYVWDALTSIASTITEQTRRTARTYGKEIGDFLTTLKEEAADALHIQEEAIKEQLKCAQEDLGQAIPTVKEEAAHLFRHLGGMIFEEEEDREPAVTQTTTMAPLDSAFFTSDLSMNPLWSKFQDAGQKRPQEAQRKVLLSNDSNLAQLHAELVPAFLEEAAFWDRWAFFNYLKKAAAGHPPAERADEPPRSPTDWETWDSTEQTGAKQQCAGKRDKPSPKPDTSSNDGWDEWE